MLPIVKNNYMRQYGSGPTFNLEIDPLPLEFNNHFIESCRTAEEIYSYKKGKLYLLYSGGIDSEFALSVFLKLGMDITPVIVRLLPTYNNHETTYAFEFCRSKNLKPVVIDIDFDNFVDSGKMFSIAKTMNCSIYHISATVHAAEQLNDTVMLGDVEPYIKNRNMTWFYEQYEHEWCAARYFKLKGIYGFTHWGCFRPEQTMAFLTDIRIQELAHNQHPGKLGSQSSKHFVYNRHSGLNLTVRPKYTGYEIIEKSEIFTHSEFNKLKTFAETCNGIYSKNYFQMLSNYGYQIARIHDANF